MGNKRMLDCQASDFKAMTSKDLLHSIRANEGRTLLVEVREDRTPHLPDLTNCELARAAGADLVLLNQMDVFQPQIWGLSENQNPIQTLKSFVQRPMGVNLEPLAPENNQPLENLEKLPAGRICSKNSLKRVEELGLNFVCLTGNPRSGVSNQAILEGIKLAKQYFSGLIIAGKMHSAAYCESISSLKWVAQFIEAGADIILLPAVGTVPGFTIQDFEQSRQLIHQKGALCMAANGMSQDCSQKEVVIKLAIDAKIAGADIIHIGCSGSGGIAPFENIMQLSIAVRGLNHTLRRMAVSNSR
ncbi:hypothetical protein [Facklamia sp. 7083-14-GEN3]|uniref:DUF7916 family protein n=1 Tax=Facklamia sp. 7083-14-GEN3 TaxID=2973478 RepID=UPI00215C3847|nr:hypothetical protein [Facklamia sp. 7083-14-GEN3]MCR8969381.1 hypothetical protein [Facklamia sp. 7083-14-GEN3]